MASHDRPAPNPSSPMIAAATPACASPRAKLVTHTTNANTAAATTTSPGDRSEPRDGAVVSRVVRLLRCPSNASVRLPKTPAEQTTPPATAPRGHPPTRKPSATSAFRYTLERLVFAVAGENILDWQARPGRAAAIAGSA